MRDMLKGFDLGVYLDGGRLALHDQGALYSWHLAGYPGIQYTYTPFAALLFAVLPKIPFRALMGLAAGVLAVAFGEWPEFWNKHIGLLQGGLIWWAPSTSDGYGDNPNFVEYHWHGLQLIVGNLYVLLGCALFVVILRAAWTYRRRHKAKSVQSSSL
jgi:hypothetical protein